MTENHPSPAYRWGVLGIIMMGTFMAILDSSIVNVSLPHMMSAFGVTRDKIQWVSTAFLLASAATMPLVGWLTSQVGYKALYLGGLFVFTLGSAACALSWSYESLVTARIIQAIGGGTIQPVGMAIVASLFEPHERGKALGIWGTGIMVAPAIGPTLGGYLTDTFNWRSIFSVNLPIGALTLLAGLLIMLPHRPPGRKAALDIWGYVFLSIGLVAGLVALSNGQQKGWDSSYIRTCAALTIFGIGMFIAVERVVESPLLRLGLFRIRNYSLSMILGVFRALGLFGSVFLLPLFLENLVGYTAIQTGLRMIPGAVAVGLTMPIAGRLADRHSPAILVTVGTMLASLSLFLFGWLDPLSSIWVIVLPQIVRGMGLAFMMSPLITAAINAVPKAEVPTASSFINVAQNVGGSIGIALMNNYVTRSIQTHAVRLGEAFPPQSPRFWVFGTRAARLAVRQSPGILATPQVKTLFAAGQSFAHRGQVLAFENGFVFAGILLLCAVPLCLLLKPNPHQQDLVRE